MQRLDRRKRARVEQWAREEGYRCPEPYCRSAKLESESTARMLSTSGGGVAVGLHCAQEWCPGRIPSYILSFDRAQALGLNMTPREFPETY
jgi:hypothetical protein